MIIYSPAIIPRIVTTSRLISTTCSLPSTQIVSLRFPKSSLSRCIKFTLRPRKFTIFPVGDKYNPQENFSELKPRINVNLASSDEIIDFLEYFDQNTLYFSNYSEKNFENIYEIDYFERREEIAKELTKSPRVKLESEDIKIRLSNITPYDSKANEYFIPYSFWYKINLKTEVDDVMAEIISVISVDREKNSGKVLKVIIHDFLLR